jgi:hypothetical protein
MKNTMRIIMEEKNILGFKQKSDQFKTPRKRSSINNIEMLKEIFSKRRFRKFGYMNPRKN